MAARLAEERKKSEEQARRNRIEARRRVVEDAFRKATPIPQDTSLFDTIILPVKGNPDTVRQALLRMLDQKGVSWKLESETKVNDTAAFFRCGGRGLYTWSHRCLVMIVELQPGAVEVYAKCLNYVWNPSDDELAAAGRTRMDGLPVHPKYWNTSDPQKAVDYANKVAEDFRQRLRKELAKELGTEMKPMGEGNPIEEFFKEAEAREANWNELLSYWCDLYPNLNYSPKELYALVAKNLQVQQVPNLESDYVMLHESGAFSSQRLYFQLRRERLVCEVCGAPFGTGFFVSSRIFDRRREATWFHIGFVISVSVLALSGFALLTAANYGWLWGVIAFTGAIAICWSLLRLAAAETLTWLDHTLADLPIIGLVYDKFFHPDTYYRQDTNNAYCTAVNRAVRQSIEEMRNQKGLKPLRDDEWRPVIRDLRNR